jgi:hypothetical protein
MLREDQSVGQRILGFEVLGDGGEPLLNGQSIGNKFIGLFTSAYTGKMVTVNVTLVNSAATLLEASVFNCSRTPQPTGCSVMQDFAYKVVPSITIASASNSNAKACCQLCTAHIECAVFVLSPTNQCTVMSANQGGAPTPGWISGEKN